MLFNFIKRAFRGSKSVRLLHSVLMPKLEGSFLYDENAKRALIDELYQSALIEFDFNEPGLGWNEWVRVGYILCFGLQLLGDSRSSRHFAYAIANGLQEVCGVIEFSGENEKMLEQYKNAILTFYETVDKGLDGFR